MTPLRSIADSTQSQLALQTDQLWPGDSFPPRAYGSIQRAARGLQRNRSQWAWLLYVMMMRRGWRVADGSWSINLTTDTNAPVRDE